MNVCLFAGPTLPPGDEARSDAFTWLPPAQHGDVYRAVTLLQPRALGIIDGSFASVPAVWHKEILWAIGRGVHMFGAASMGALRAAELAAFGMHGAGLVYEAYRNGTYPGTGEPFEDDDEVAVVHGPAETGYAASEAMVNIRSTLLRAEHESVLGADTRAQLAALAKALYFPERTYERLLEQARLARLEASQIAALEAWLPEGRVNQKREDALELLRHIAAWLEGNPAPAQATFHFEHTTLWERARAAMLDARPGRHSDAPQAGSLSGLQQLQLTDWYFSRVLGREMPDDLERWVDSRGFRDVPQFHQAILDEYVRRHG